MCLYIQNMQELQLTFPHQLIKINKLVHIEMRERRRRKQKIKSQKRRKTRKKRIRGQIHILANFSNAIATLNDMRGNVIRQAFEGSLGSKKHEKCST